MDGFGQVGITCDLHFTCRLVCVLRILRNIAVSDSSLYPISFNSACLLSNQNTLSSQLWQKTQKQTPNKMINLWESQKYEANDMQVLFADESTAFMSP